MDIDNNMVYSFDTISLKVIDLLLYIPTTVPPRYN